MHVPVAPERAGEVLLGRRAIIGGLLWLAAAALAIVWLGRCTDLDLVLADRAFDRGAGVFPWRHAWLAETFSHKILKLALTAAGVLAIAVAVAELVRPSARAGHRLRLQLVALAAILVPLATSTLKRESIAHCPWDLERYGGTQPYVRLFESLPHGALAGHCLPGGHASTALWLLALGVFWLPHAPRKALAVSATAAMFGFAIGWIQQLRGAHFLTHTLWSVWVAAFIVLVLGAALQGREARRRPAPLAPERIGAQAEPGEASA